MRYSYFRILPLIAIALSTVSTAFAQPVVPSVTASAQNITVSITPSSGPAVVNAQQLNLNSSSTCGAPTYKVLPDGPAEGTLSGAQIEYSTLLMAAPTGKTFTNIDFASYGLPTPPLNMNQLPTGGYAVGDCHAPNSVAVVGSYLLGNSTAAIPVQYSTFGYNLCGEVKRLYVVASYINGTPAPSLTFTAAGTYPVVLVVQNGCGASSIARATVTVLDARCGNKNDKFNLCHNGQQICVAGPAVAAHLAHGDSYGDCGASRSAAPAIAVEAAPATEMLVQAAPNPSNDGQFRVHVEAITDGPVQVNLFDMQGNLVSQLYNGRMAQGEQRDFSINRPDLVRGLYLVRVQHGAKASSLRLEVQK